MRTIKNAVQELVIEMDATWMEESSAQGYAPSEVAVEPVAIAEWAGVTEGTTMADLLEAGPVNWTEVTGKHGGSVWYRCIPQDGPAALVQVTCIDPATQRWFWVELDGALAA